MNDLTRQQTTELKFANMHEHVESIRPWAPTVMHRAAYNPGSLTKTERTEVIAKTEQRKAELKKQVQALQRLKTLTIGFERPARFVPSICRA